MKTLSELRFFFILTSVHNPMELIFEEEGNMKKMTVIALLLFLVVSMTACAPDTPVDGDSTSESAADEKIKLVFSVNAVPGDAHHYAMMKFEEVVEAKSNGLIEVETHHSGSLFKQDQELAAVKSGQVDFVYLSAAWLTEGSPWISMFTAGYMFRSYEHMTNVLNG